MLLVCRGLRFMCVFRFKMWWMTQRMGNCGKDIPFETQFLIVETDEGSQFDEQSAVYTVFLPIIEGDFRAVLQGNEHDELEICLESGTQTQEINFFEKSFCCIINCLELNHFF